MADHLRQPLADAIDGVSEAGAYVAKVVSAKSRLDDQGLVAYRAKEAAEATLRAARKEAPADLVQAILDDADDGEAVREAEATLRAAEQAGSRLERQRDALREEEHRARMALETAKGRAADAVSAVLKAAPAVEALLASLHVARKRVATIEAALHTLPVTALPYGWASIRAEDEAPDPDLADRWRKSLAALKVDAAAEFPEHRIVAKIERVIVDPKAEAA
jgi:chromosome segregation ATPase